MHRDNAETVALKALAWVIGAEAERDAFLAASGFAPADLMQRAGEAEVLLAVIDFILTEDRRVIGFCDSAGLAYDSLAAVRAALPGGDDHHWT